MAGAILLRQGPMKRALPGSSSEGQEGRSPAETSYSSSSLTALLSQLVSNVASLGSQTPRGLGSVPRALTTVCQGPQVLLSRDSPQPVGLNLYSCSALAHPICRTLDTSLMNFLRFLLSHLSSLNSDPVSHGTHCLHL